MAGKHLEVVGQSTFPHASHNLYSWKRRAAMTKDGQRGQGIAHGETERSREQGGKKRARMGSRRRESEREHGEGAGDRERK